MIRSATITPEAPRAGPARTLATIIAAGRYYGRQLAQAPQRINIEFGSAPATGPLRPTHGRAAVLGECLATLLEWQGHMVQRESYVTDVGEPLRRVGEALWARVQQAVGRSRPGDDGSRGAWLGGLAQRLLARHGWLFADQVADAGIEACRKFAVGAIKTEHCETLAACRVKVDVLFAETRLYTDRQLERVLAALGASGVLHEEGGELWLRTAAWAGSADQILRHAGGDITAMALDIAYHEDRAVRGFDRLINVRDADQPGDASRISRAMTALGRPDNFVAALTVQPVTVMRAGMEVTSSTRSGERLTLRDLVDEAGADVVRWVSLARDPGEPVTLDLDVATGASAENPLGNVQQAHARTAGLFRATGIDPARVTGRDLDAPGQAQPGGAGLLNVLARFPEVVHAAAEALEPRQVTDYCEALAQAAHRWHDDNPRAASPGRPLQVQLAVARATLIVLANALDLIGVSAPERLRSIPEVR